MLTFFICSLYTGYHKKNLLSVGFLADILKTFIFKSAGCFIVDNDTLDLVGFSPRENGKGSYKLGGRMTSSSPEVNLLHPHLYAALWHKGLDIFILKVCNE